MDTIVSHQQDPICLCWRFQIKVSEFDQRSVPGVRFLGLIFFTIYTQPLGDIVHQHNMHFHLYANDTQLYMTFDSNLDESKQSALSCTQSCINEIKDWMHYNKLKLKGDKTEFPHFHPTTRNNSTASIPTIIIGNNTVSVNISL